MLKEDKILDSARELFAKFGPKKVTTDDISRAAHISKATIYKHYRNKTEIFERIVEIECRTFLVALGSVVDAEATSVEKFRSYILTRLTKVRELVVRYGVNEDSWGAFNSYLSKLAGWFFEEEKDIIKRILQQGIRDGELQMKRVDLCAHITAVTFQSIELPWVLEAQGIAASDYAAVIIDMIYNGIRKR